MAKVFLHTRSPGNHDWTNESREFARVPAIGEFLTLASDSEWYRVQVVVHTPFPCDYEAEVFAVEVEHLSVMTEAFVE